MIRDLREFAARLLHRLRRKGPSFLRGSYTPPGQAHAMRQVVAVIADLQERFDEPLSCIETGTIRSYHEKHDSTLHIARQLGEKGHLVSVDLDPHSIAVSRDICFEQTNVTWVEAASTDYLSGLTDERFHFALLDSANDKDLIFEEFTLILPHMHTGGIILVDDAGIAADGSGKDPAVQAQKGHKVWDFLIQHDIPHQVLPTIQKHGTQLRIDLDAAVLQRLKTALGEGP